MSGCSLSSRSLKNPGIRGRTTEALKLMGITRVEELANCDIQRLSERFGKMGLWMKQMAHGLDFSEVKEWEEAAKSKAGAEHLRKIQRPFKNCWLSGIAC